MFFKQIISVAFFLGFVFIDSNVQGSFMKLSILGSGKAYPHPKRNAPAYHLSCDNQSFLIDCGSGTLHQLARMGLDVYALDGIFITHFHMDHF